MSSAGLQELTSFNTRHKNSSSTSDDPSNAQTIAHRSASPTKPQRMNYVPPAVPSPPSRRSTPSFRGNTPLSFTRSFVMAEDEDLSKNQWFFTEDQINTSPSIDGGISPEEERTRRAKGVNFIVQAGILLKIPQTTLAAASVFFHRYYMRYSMVPEKGGIHHYNIAATALFLATKSEETCRKTKEIVIAVARVAQKNANLIIDEQSKEFWRWRDSILLYEESMLEALTFDVVLKSPYTLLYDFLRALDIVENKRLRDVAWSFLNDSCMTTLCLRMGPKDIAVTAIYFSARFNNERIPDDAEDKPWWRRLSGIESRIEEAVTVMNQFYAENPLKKPDNPYDQSPGSSEEDLDKSRLRNGVSPNETVKSEDVKGESVDGRNGNTSTNGSLVNGDNRNIRNGHHEKDDSVKGSQDMKSEDVKMEDHEEKAELARGDSDAALKEAANDPATHEKSAPNGMNGTKRPSVDIEDPIKDSEAKRPKLEAPEELSEEGELEE